MYLLDTNVISETSRPAPEIRVLEWLATLERATLSVIALAEIEYGIGRAEPGRQAALRLWHEELKRTAEFVPVSEQMAGLAGRLRAECARRGRQLTLAHALIAAAAAVTKRTLATRNVKDFEGCGIPLFNPFETSLR